MRVHIPLLALLAFTMTGLPSLAVHGEAYDAYGTATRGGELLLAVVHWSGYNFEPSSTFTVELKDTAGNVVSTESFRGCWTANGPVSYWELLLYKGWAAGATGSCTPGDSQRFQILGAQFQAVAQGAPNRAVMLYVGNYNDWQLQLVVPYGVEPF